MVEVGAASLVVLGRDLDPLRSTVDRVGQQLHIVLPYLLFVQLAINLLGHS